MGIENNAETITRETAEARFLERHGCSSSDWLARWRANQIADTFENNAITCEATWIGTAANSETPDPA